MREDVPAKAIKATKLGIFEEQGRCVEAFGPKLDLVRALESGRIVSRDVGGSDPERMAPPRYCLYFQSMSASFLFNPIFNKNLTEFCQNP